MLERPFINVHIEKTAGRSARSLFIDTYGPNQVLTYDPTTDLLLRSSDRLIATERPGQETAERIVSNKVLAPLAKLGLGAAKGIERRKAFRPEQLPKDYSVITGHFTGARFEDIQPPETARYVSVVREPMERMRSHYEHWKRTQGIAHFRVPIPYSAKMEFGEFAFLSSLQNYQASALSFGVGNYHLIGVVDYFQEYIEELGLIDKQAIAPHMNKASYKAPEQLSPTFKARFAAFHSQDYDLYYSTLEAWK